MVVRAPRRELLPFVSRLWASEGEPAPGGRERVLPTGAVHVAVRLDQPLRVFDAIDAARPRTIGRAVIGGARAAPYIRDVSLATRSVGAQLRPGAAALLLGTSGRALAGRHIGLDDVWGAAATELCDRLAAARGPAQQLDCLEAALLARLPRVRGVHPAVAHALARFAAGDDIATVVDDVGYSHRRFIALFDDAVGLTPKLYCRVQRMSRAIAQIGRLPLAQLAARMGYSDQAHLTRELRALIGLSPGEYRALAPLASHHVPVR